MGAPASTPVSDADFVAAVGVQWQRRPLAPEPGLAALLAQARLDDGGKATVVQAVGALVVDECVAHGYHSMDLVVLHPETPGLDEALDRFDKPHTHADDEVRYILDGEGLFGFFDASGQERVLCVQPGDYLRIPAGVEHRFTLTASRRIKALRLFADTAGWVAQYTGRPAAAMEVPA
jgi:1,2-dihydroxy-3-keto-5-methylthiopentene dioxygenase